MALSASGFHHSLLTAKLRKKIETTKYLRRKMMAWGCYVNGEEGGGDKKSPLLSMSQ